MSPQLHRFVRANQRLLGGIRRGAIYLGIIFTALASGGPHAWAQYVVTPNNVSEGGIGGLFTSGGSTTPLYVRTSPVLTNGIFCYPIIENGGVVGCAFNCGIIVSAVYNLGGGRYLYAYELDARCLFFAVTSLTVPLGGATLMPTGSVSTGAYWTGDWATVDSPVPAFTGVFSPFNQYGFLPNSDCDGIAEARVSSNAITFVVPGPCPAVHGAPGVGYATPVFGFITDVPPRIIKGQFAADADGVPLSAAAGFPPPSDSPAFEIVAPTNISLVDPVPDLLSGPKVTTHADTLATAGRVVQGLAADGVTEVLLRLPAGHEGDRFTLTLQDFVSADEDGALGNPGDSQFSQSSLTVTAVNTSEGPMAFAIYRAPLDFPQASVSGAFCATRIERLQVQLMPQGSSSTATTNLDITILRPPILLVHGLWSSDAAWDSFSPFDTSSAADPCFPVRKVDYSQFQGSLASPPIVASDPPYNDIVLRDATSSALGFAFNALAVLSRADEFIREFKKGQNALEIPVAAVQADFVAHSMGGDLVRYMPWFFGSDFYDSSTFGQGMIHKLITIGTPHLGSPLATELPKYENSCIRNLLANAGLPAFSSVTFGSGFGAIGAMEDLSGDGSGTSMSGALYNISFQGSAQLIPAAMIAGVQPDFSSLDSGTVAWGIRNLLCPTNPLALSLTSTGWKQIVSSNSDAVVPLTSQWDARTGVGVRLDGVIHTNDLRVLGFQGNAELDPASNIPNQVIFLLNKPLNDTQYYSRLTP